MTAKEIKARWLSERRSCFLGPAYRTIETFYMRVLTETIRRKNGKR